MKPTATLIVVALLSTAPAGWAQTSPQDGGVRVETPRAVLSGVPFEVSVHADGVAASDSIAFVITASGASEPIASGYVAGGESVKVADLTLTSGRRLRLESGSISKPIDPRVLPGWFSVLPPLVAIVFALLFRQVIVSLLAGVWLGALFVNDWRPITALARTVDDYILGSMTSSSNAQILIFTMLLGGMVGIISRNGGAHGIVESITRYAVGPIRGQLAAYVMGLLIFFDDYSNTLIVGSTMRPVTDRLRISREKLAYIVDSTAAPVASIALISGWIGVEVGLIAGAIEGLDVGVEPYVLFVQSIPYRFYPILALAFVAMVIVTDRDYGPMLKAEIRARKEGKPLRDGASPASDFDSEALDPVRGKPHRWWNGLIPIGVVAVLMIVGMYVTGRSAIVSVGGTDLGIQNIFSNGDSYVSLVWGSAAGCLVAALMTLGQRILSLEETMSAWLSGLKAMLLACVILILAWSIGSVTSDVHTADYIVGLLTGQLDPRLLPVLVFVMCAFVSFATGTSWGTMAIMMPIVVPLAVALSADAGLAADAAHTILVGSISGVLAGAVWGDHCSPISDTTILSSLATSSDHIDHVRTQIPYALAVGFVGMLVGDIPTAYGFSPWISLVLGCGVLWGLLRLLGKRVDEV